MHPLIKTSIPLSYTFFYPCPCAITILSFFSSIRPKPLSFYISICLLPCCYFIVRLHIPEPITHRPEFILTKTGTGYFFIGIIEATDAMEAFISFLLLQGWQYGMVDLADPYLHRQAMTMTLLGAISCQLTNVWTMRSWEFSAFSVGLFLNPLLIGTMVIELAWIWMLLYVEPVQNIFNAATIPLADLRILLPLPILLFSSHEFYKWRKRKQLDMA